MNTIIFNFIILLMIGWTFANNLETVVKKKFQNCKFSILLVLFTFIALLKFALRGVF